MERNLEAGPGGADDLVAAFEAHRRYLLNVAYRLLGSVTEAEDMVQETFVRLLRADVGSIEDLRGWLVVVVTRLCLDHLRSARTRREVQTGPWLPEPLIRMEGVDPADIVTLDESVRMALLIVLERLSPAERVVFVLHEVFEYSFEEIAPMVDRTPAACRQLGSRARRRIASGEERTPARVDPDEMRRVAERFIRACEGRDLQPLLEVLDPQVVGWADLGALAPNFPQPNIGRDNVAARTAQLFGAGAGVQLKLAEVNGESGILAFRNGRPMAVLSLMVRDERVTAIYAIVDPRKLARLGADSAVR